MKVLVTGSDGFIGKHLTKMLQAEGYEVVGLDIKTGNDVVFCALPSDVGRVFHLAAQTDARTNDGLGDARDNILSAVRIMHAYGDKVVYPSSSAVNYLTTPYAISKKAGEMYAKLYGCGVVRFCNIYGAGGRSFIDRYQHEPVVKANLPGTQIRTYAHVAKACRALIECKPGELNILEGRDYTVRQIVEEIYPGKTVYWNPSSEFDVIEGRQVYGVQP